MLYEVLNDFVEKEHKNEIYRKGDTYPREPYKVIAKRVSFLRETHPSYGVAFLGDEVKDEESKQEVKKPQTTKKVVKKDD